MKENKTEKQPETAKKNERGRKESQPLTPEEIRKRRKMLVYPLLFLVFGVAMWLIFAPSDEGESLPDGFNVEVPMPEEKNLPSDKRAAYEQQDFERKQREKMSTLQDLAVAEDDTDREAVEDVFQTEETASSGGSSIRTSADAYRDINRQIGSFYEQPEPEDDQKTLELEWRIQELERRAEEERKAKETADEQLRLMEKSYEMASRYLPQEGWRSEVRTRNGNGGKDGQPGHAGGGAGRVDAGTTDVRCRVHGTVQPSPQHGVPHGNRPSAHGRQEQHPCLHPAHGYSKRRQGGGNPPAGTD